MKTSIIGLFVTMLLLLLSAVWLWAPFTAHATEQSQSPQSVNPESVSVLVELQEPPVLQVYAALRARAGVQAAQTGAATQAQLATIEQAQQRLLGTLTALDARVLYRNQRVYNGIAVRIAATKVEQLRQLPDVKAVHTLIAKRPAMTERTPLSGAPVLWQGVNGVGLTGQGLTIAVVDTGVDYLHTDLGGPGVGYATNNPVTVGDVVGFPNAKVIGGYDFAGDEYNAEADDSSFQPIPAPDPDPMDCYAHGTHVAGIAAGSGVNLDGSAYQGAYNLDTNVNHLKIPPGVAPQAQIYAIKVFGCTGSSEIVDQGIERAVDPNGDGDLSDHADVINLSLGSPYGGLDDPTAIASDNAAAAGVIVIASAGNSGDVTYVTGSPAIANHVISVAAGQIDTTNFETLASFSARGPRRLDSALKPDLTAPGYHIVSAAYGTGNGSLALSGTSMAAPHAAGAFALLRQLHPDWSGDDLKALVMNSALTQIRTNQTITAPLYSPTRIGAGQLDLERAQQTDVIAYNADDPGLVSVSFGTPQVLTDAVALKNVRLANKSDHSLAYSLSYAGVTDTPGVDFLWPTQTFTVAAGSFANIPIRFTANAAQMRHTRDQTQSAQQGNQARAWLSEKTGYLLFWPLTGSFTATLDGSETLPAVSTSVQGSATFHYSPQTQVLSYTVTISGAAMLTNTNITVNRGPAGATGPIAYLLHTGDVAQATAYTGALTLDPGDEALLRDGVLYVNLTSPDHPTGLLRGQIRTTDTVLAVPIYAAPCPAAAMHATEHTLAFGHTLQSSLPLPLQGIGVSGSQFPTEVISLVSAVGLQWSSPNLPPANPITGTEGSRADQYDHADLKYVGVASDFAATQTPVNPAGAVAQSTLYFGLATYSNWSTPNEVRFEFYIDTDHDGVDDIMLFNTDRLGYISDNNTSDALITALKNLHTGFITPREPLNAISPATQDTSPYNTNVMLLPITANALGLTDANPSFEYYVESYSNDRPRPVDGSRRYVDRSPRFHVDLHKSGLQLTGGQLGAPIYRDLAGEQIVVGFDLAAYAEANWQGILLLHDHNVSGQHDEVVGITYEWPNTLYLPIIGR